jgi:hypothetical protein
MNDEDPTEPIPPSNLEEDVTLDEPSIVTFQENAETHEEPEMIELLDENIVWIEVARENDKMNIRYPYTRMDIKELEFEYSSVEKFYDDNTFRCYCLATKKYTTIDFDSCLYYHYNDTYEKQIESLLGEIKQIEDTIRELPHVSEQVIIDTKYRRWLETETGVVWDSYKFTEFKIDNLEKIYTNTIEPELFDELRGWYLDKIRSERSIAFTELDELEGESKAAGATDEDLQDIDTIKQMFRDIPQDIDLKQFKTIGDMFDFWPSLLQPRKLGCIDPVVKTILVHEDQLESLKKMLTKCTSDDIEELEALLEHVRSTIPQGAVIEDWSIDRLEARIKELKTPGIN